MIAVPVNYKGIKLNNFTFYVAKGKSLMGVNLFDKLGFKLLVPTGTHIHMIADQDNAYKHLYPSLFIGFGECKSYCHAS